MTVWPSSTRLRASTCNRSKNDDIDKAGYDSKYAAMYWPWVGASAVRGGFYATHPDTWQGSGRATTTLAASTKRRRTKLCAVLFSLETQITRKEHDLLNPVGINCIRAFPGARNPRLGCTHAVV